MHQFACPPYWNGNFQCFFSVPIRRDLGLPCRTVSKGGPAVGSRNKLHAIMRRMINQAVCHSSADWLARLVFNE